MQASQVVEDSPDSNDYSINPYCELILNKIGRAFKQKAKAPVGSKHVLLGTKSSAEIVVYQELNVSLDWINRL